MMNIDREKSMTKEITLSDKEVCRKLKISYGTLYNHLKNGPPRKRHQNVSDIRNICYTVINGQRRWFAESVNEFITKRGGK